MSIAAPDIREYWGITSYLYVVWVIWTERLRIRNTLAIRCMLASSGTLCTFAFITHCPTKYHFVLWKPKTFCGKKGSYSNESRGVMHDDELVKAVLKIFKIDMIYF
jgi:hypothetical protein